jgi:hypothetical protein
VSNAETVAALDELDACRGARARGTGKQIIFAILRTQEGLRRAAWATGVTSTPTPALPKH